jgi:competence protein ComEA
VPGRRVPDAGSLDSLASTLEAAVSRFDRILIAAIGGTVVLALAAGIVLLAPIGASPSPSPDTAALLAPSPSGGIPPTSAATGVIVVDVAGAVAQPGVRELPPGARLADAIEAAGGFATDADLEAASALNLAQPLVDGQQVRVPRLGDSAIAAAPSAPAPAGIDGGAAGGLVDVNTATPEELEALPGIGAVTVQKIVAARQEEPFSSLQDMVDRGIIHRGQLEDITGLASAG